MEARNMGRSSKSSSLSAYFQLQYLFSPLTPTVYQKLAYLRPQTETVDSLWSAASPSSLSILGMGADIGFTLGIPMSIGGRTTFFREFTSQADYNEVQENFAEINQVAQAVGAWFEIFRGKGSLVDSCLGRHGYGLSRSGQRPYWGGWRFGHRFFAAGQGRYDIFAWPQQHCLALDRPALLREGCGLCRDGGCLGHAARPVRSSLDDGWQWLGYIGPAGCGLVLYSGG